MVGERLRELRRIKGMTQLQLAREVGLSASAIGMYEQGRREPDNDTLARLCALFDVSSDFLLGKERYTEQDLDEVIEQVREAILSQKGLMFHGRLVSPGDCEKIVDAIQLGIQFVLAQKDAGEAEP